MLLVACFLLPAAFSPDAFAAAEGAAPVAYWTFNEAGGTTAYDESSGNYDGTLNGATWTRQGKVGNALSFDGTNDYVNIASTGIGNFAAGSIAAWIYPTSLTGGINCNTHNGSSACRAIAFSDDFGYFFAVNSDGALTLDLGNGSSWVVVNNTAASLVTTGVWQHVAVTVTGTTVKYYVNGVLKATNTVAANSGLKLGNNNRLGLGGAALAPTSYPFSGRLDDARLYNYVRTDEHILLDYNAGSAAHLGAGTDPNEGNPPVGYWPLDDNTGTTALDKSGSGNNGTLTAGPTWTKGKYGSAVSVDGADDYVDVPVSSVLNYSGNTITMAAWIYPRSFTYGGTNTDIGVIVQHTGAYYLSVDGNGKATAYFQNVTGSHTPSNSALPLNAWSHVAVTYDGSNVRWYLNGALDKTLAASGSFPTDARSVKIGGEFGFGRFFNAILDDVRIYNYARSTAQVAYDYSRGKPVAHYTFDEGTGKIAHNDYSTADTGTAPIAWWRLDEGSGTSAADYSGNGKTGTLGASTAAPTWVAGKIGSNALSFDNGDTVSVGTVGGYSNAVTIEAWVNHTTAADWDDIVAGGCGDLLLAFNGSNQLRWSGQCNDPFTGLTYTTSIDGAWHHVAATYDGATARLYVDGVLVSSGAASGSFTPGALRIGSSASSEYFTGSLDDVRLYNYARTAEQVYNDAKTTHGTLVGDAKFVDGKLGKALTFDGTGDYAVMPNPSTSQTFTASLWFRTPTPATNMYLLDRGGNTHWFELLSSKLRSGTSAANYSDGPTTIQANTWYHAAMTYDGTTVTQYLNGVQSFSIAGGSVTPSGLDLGRQTGAAASFNGLIDDVRIYTYARNAEQVLQDYNAGAAIRLGAQSTGVADPWSGALPVAHWKLDDNTGVLARDASGNGKDGTLTNGPTWALGKKGSALNFDGDDDYVNIGTLTGLAAAAHTITAWVKPSAVSGTQEVLDSNGGSVSLYLNGAGLECRAGSTPTSSVKGTLSAGVWSHVACTYNGSTIRNYINGVDVGSTAASGNDNPNVWSISRSGNTFGGAIDEVKVYAYALSAAQVAWDHNRGQPTAHWRFEGNAQDVSGNGNTGTVSGATLVAGKFGQCYDFSGGNTITIPYSSSIALGGGDMTVAAWIYMDTIGSYNTFYSNSNSGRYYSFWIYDSGGGAGRGYVEFGGTQASGWIDITPPITASSWQHLAVVRESNVAKVYRNGVLAGTLSRTATTNLPSGVSLVFGNDGTDTGIPWDGKMDDIRIYNYARSAEQILQDYLHGAASRLGD